MPDDQTIQLENVRLSFPNIFDAKASQEGGEAKFSASFLLDKVKQADLIKAVKIKMFTLACRVFDGEPKEGEKQAGAKTLDLMKKGKLTYCIHEGEEKKEWDGYDETNMYISSSSSTRPTVIDRDMSPLVKADGRPYGGCYVNAVVRVWVQDNQYGKKVNAELQGIQFSRDGDAFGKPPFKPEEHFKPLDKPKEKANASTDAPADDEIPF